MKRNCNERNREESADMSSSYTINLIVVELLMLMKYIEISLPCGELVKSNEITGWQKC
jgi:hypothetical protein